jgi:hypothetical protein
MHRSGVPARILIACHSAQRAPGHGIGKGGMSDNFGLEIGSGWFGQQPVHQRAERRMRGGGDGLIGQARIAGIAREGHELAEGGAGEGAGARH